MINHCGLEIENNKCPYYLAPDTCKAAESKCSFFVSAKPVKQSEERKPKWYEQYYQKK